VRDFLLPVDVIIHPASGEPVRVNLSGLSDLYLVSTIIFYAPLDLKVHLDYILPKFLTFESRIEMMKPVKINPFARMVLSWFSRLFFKPEAFSFTQKVKESQSVLICMPANVDRFAMARDLLSTFVDIFQEKEVFVLLPFLEAEGYLSSSTRYGVISTQKGDLNVFSLPRKKFIQKLKDHQFDISLDLDLGNGFFNCYLCLKCKVPLRIGAKRKNAFPHYNIQLAITKDRLGSREIYEGLAKMLKSLFSESGKTVPDFI
jgi:hypothetical protein